jgi:hypothetical protein
MEELVDSDAELLLRVNSTKDFFGSVFNRDAFDDWNLAKDFGEFLVRILPDSDIMGHAVLARAHRHLGNTEQALAELNRCRAQAGKRKLKPWEAEIFCPFLQKEEGLLSEGPARRKKRVAGG